MSFRLGNTAVCVGYEAVAAIAAVLILDRENHVVCCIAAAILHELGHILMMRLFRIRVRSVSVRIFDVGIEADRPASFSADIGVTVGGPVMNFICAAAFAPLSRDMTLANLALGVFNLLPVMSLDGGRLLYLLLSRRFLPKICTIILKTVSFLLLIPFLTAGLLMLFRSGYNYSLLVISLYLLTVLLLK